MNKLSGLLLAVLLLAVANAWGACIYKPAITQAVEVKVCAIGPTCLKGGCQYKASCEAALEASANACPPTHHFNGYFYVQPIANSRFSYYVPGSGSIFNCPSTNTGCYGDAPNGYFDVGCNYQLQCDNQCDADSVVCINNGGTWTNTGASTCNGKSCKMSNCLQSDTLWLNDSKAACDAIGGENNYAITDIDETCVHSGICCPRDSALVGNTCKWRCDSLYAACIAKNGYWYAGVLQDTTISGADSTFTNKCYYNCSYAYNKDSTTSVTDGNTACASPSTPIADCTRMPNDFSSVRTTYGDSVYSYDFLTPGSAAYIDSIVLTPCSRFMYRCTVNGKYKYWYSDADIPTGCTNIVKIK